MYALYWLTQSPHYRFSSHDCDHENFFFENKLASGNWSIQVKFPKNEFFSLEFSAYYHSGKRGRPKKVKNIDQTPVWFQHLYARLEQKVERRDRIRKLFVSV